MDARSATPPPLEESTALPSLMQSDGVDDVARLLAGRAGEDADGGDRSEFLRDGMLPSIEESCASATPLVVAPVNGIVASTDTRGVDDNAEAAGAARAAVSGEKSNDALLLCDRIIHSTASAAATATASTAAASTPTPSSLSEEELSGSAVTAAATTAAASATVRRVFTTTRRCSYVSIAQRQRGDTATTAATAAVAGNVCGGLVLADIV